MRDHDLTADRLRYGRRAGLREQSWWAVRVYRWGRRVDRSPPTQRRLLLPLYWGAYRIVETLTGISLPKEAVFGPGLRIHHFGGIVIHPRTVVGAGCTLRHGVTLGARGEDGAAPRLGDDVELGAYAQVLGPVHVGDHARLGALSLVVTDVPAHGVVVGRRGVLRDTGSPERHQR